jgi:hypothetical protein
MRHRAFASAVVVGFRVHLGSPDSAEVLPWLNFAEVDFPGISGGSHWPRQPGMIPD